MHDDHITTRLADAAVEAEKDLKSAERYVVEMQDKVRDAQNSLNEALDDVARLQSEIPELWAEVRRRRTAAEQAAGRK